MAHDSARSWRRSPTFPPKMLLIAVALAVLSVLAVPADAAGRKDEAVWPQEFKTDGIRLVFYEPQWDALEKNTLTGRSALGITAKGKTTPVFGAAWIEADVSIDREAGKVTATAVRVTKVHLPDSTPAEEDQLFEQARKVARDIDVTTSLQTLSRGLEATRHERDQSSHLSMTAPRVLFQTTPAFLVVLDGEPKTVKVKGTDLERVVNTPSFLVRDTDRKRFYLQGAGRWHEAKAVKGPWKSIDAPPDEVEKLYASDTESAKAASQDGAGEVKDTREADENGKGPAPEVIVATEPTELIVTDGPPKFNPIAGGDLLYLSNTGSDVLMDVASQQYYVLLSGRWFRSSAMEGPWQYVRADNLPDSFAKIPAGSAKGDVLASVAGTPQAEEAVDDAQVPQTAAVKRDEAHLEVQYDGEPQFRNIDGTDVAYALNTTTQVLKINGRFYAVDQGVWFTSETPDGPWVLADEVPQEVQEIPPDSPAYNTKYVYVYDSDPEVVYYGYTPGYVGSYPYHGTVVWGTGWYYPGWWGTAYYPYPWTWGFSAHYSYGWGWSFGFGWGGYWPYYPYYGYPVYAHYPYYPYWGYPGYVWGYPGWWGPYGHCNYATPYAGRYARGAAVTAAAGTAARVPRTAAGLPASRLPQGTNVNLYRGPNNAPRTASTRDKHARVASRRGVTAGPANAQVSARPGNAGTPSAGTPSAGAQRVPSNRGVVARPATPGRSTAATTPPGQSSQGPRATRPGQARPVPATPPTGGATVQGQGQARQRPQARPPQAGRPASPGAPQSQTQAGPSTPGRPQARATTPSRPSQARPATPSRPSQPGRPSARPSQPGAPPPQARPSSPQSSRPQARPSSPQSSRPSSPQVSRPSGSSRPSSTQGRVYSRPSQPRPSGSMRGPTMGGGGSRGYSGPSMSGGMGGGRSMSAAPRGGGGFGGGRSMSGGRSMGGGGRVGGGAPRGGGGGRH